jgi:ankyrin repeat protein
MKKYFIFSLFFLSLCSLPTLFAGQVIFGSDSPEEKKLKALASKRQGGETTLHVAIAENDEDVVKLILGLNQEYLNELEGMLGQKSGDILNQQDDLGQTVLEKAIINKANGILDLLLDNPAIDPNQTIKNKITPLHLAVKLGNKQAIEKLLDNEKVVASINNKMTLGKNIEGPTPLYLVVESDIFEPGDKLELVKLLLSKGANPNISVQKISLFSRAIKSTDETLVKELVMNKNGIDINKKDEFGFVPLYLAVANNLLQVAEALLSKKTIDITMANNEGILPLHEAAQKGFTDIVIKIIDKNPYMVTVKSLSQISFIDSGDKTALDYALEGVNKNTSKAILNKMLKHGFINDIGYKGRTPLLAAVELGDKDLVRKFLIAGAKKNINAVMKDIDNEQQTALDLAMRYDFPEITKLLMNNQGKTFAQLEQERKDAEKISQEKKEQEEVTQRQQALEKQKAEAVEAVIQEKALLELARALKALG